MKRLFYTRRLDFLKVFTFAAFLATACAPRIQKIDDAKLSGVPVERLAAVNEAKKELAMSKAALEKVRDAAMEAEYRLRIVRAALRVAEARAEQSREEFALAKFQNQNESLVKAGENQRAGEVAIQRAGADVKVAQAKLRAAEAKIAETEKRVAWLEAKQEYERAKVALKYDDGTPSQKSVALNSYEQVSIATELEWKTMEGKLQAAQVDLEQAEVDRAALEKVH